MALTIGRNTNTNDTATLSSAVALNATTSTTVAVSLSERIVFTFSNPGNKDVWLKLQAASVDNDMKGIFIPRNGYWEMPTDNIYTGEISAIAVSGTPSVHITEY